MVMWCVARGVVMVRCVKMVGCGLGWGGGELGCAAADVVSAAWVCVVEGSDGDGMGVVGV